MKTTVLTLWSMGRSLVRLKDRTGAYKLPKGNPFPKFGSTGRRGAVLPSAARSPAPEPQAILFEEPAAQPAPAPASAPFPPAGPVSPPHQRRQDTPPAPAPVPAPSAPTASQPPVARPARRLSSILHSALCLLHSPMARLARVFKPGSRSLAQDSRPRAQAELALEKVTVLRNDLSEADLVVVAVEPKKEDPKASNPASSQTEIPGARPTARWIELKGQPARGHSEPAPRRLARLVEMQP